MTFPSDSDVLRLVLAAQMELKGALATVQGHLERIERTLAVPTTYTHDQACRRLGISRGWGAARRGR